MIINAKSFFKKNNNDCIYCFLIYKILRIIVSSTLTNFWINIKHSKKSKTTFLKIVVKLKTVFISKKTNKYGKGNITNKFL